MGVATATIAALLGLECTVFMGAKDVQRQELNVFRMKLLGAKVVAVESGSKTLKDAMNDAIRYSGYKCKRYFLYNWNSCRSSSIPYDGARFSSNYWL